MRGSLARLCRSFNSRQSLWEASSELAAVRQLHSRAAPCSQVVLDALAIAERSAWGQPRPKALEAQASRAFCTAGCARTGPCLLPGAVG